jgi:hypothetical protein
VCEKVALIFREAGFLVSLFYNQEKDYEDWCQENIDGYIFNNAGGKTGNVLHKVGCSHLTVTLRIGTYTTRYPKYCSTDITVLSMEADKVSKPYRWRRCKGCFKD